MENQKNIVGLYVVIAILGVLVLCLGGYIVYDKILNNKELDLKDNYNTENTDNDVEQSSNYLKGKISFNNYCSNSAICDKKIGNININNQLLKLSVNLENLNTENVSGNISLGSKDLNVSNLSYFASEKVFDGFEVYQDYLILYMSSLDTLKSENSDCEAKGYVMYILNSNLEEVSVLAGYTPNNAFKDFKIENNYLYYYALSTKNDYPATLVYEKINFNDLSNKKYDSSSFISNVSNCKLGS